jgi:site-specific recombinase XerC
MRQTSGPERAFATGPCFMWALWRDFEELTGLLHTAVTLQPTPTLRVVGKGRKERSLPLWKQTAADLRAWLACEATPPRRNCSSMPRAGR